MQADNTDLNAGRLTQYIYNGRNLYTTPTLSKFFDDFEYFKIRGISLKIYSLKGPTWGSHGAEADEALSDIDNIGWLVPNNLQDSRKFTSNSAYRDNQNLPPSTFIKFINTRNATHRLTYWDKPIKIYCKYPNWIDRERTSSSSTDWSDGDTSDLHKYKWHETSRMQDTKYDTVWFGPSVGLLIQQP